MASDNQPLRIFIGMDHRQPVAYTVLSHSIAMRASRPVAITPLLIKQLPVNKKGLTEFTYSRYLVPYLCNYQGYALFVDADFLCLEDVSQLFACADNTTSVQIVKNQLQYEWPSLMLFNCAQCEKLTPEYIDAKEPSNFEWGTVGKLPPEWNFLVGYDELDNMPSMIHYTQGIPIFPEMKGTLFYEQWHDELQSASESCSWLELMSQSVHAKPVIKRLEDRMKAFAAS